MLQIVVFSFNRAMQLDTLLTSLVEKWKSPSYELYVLYNTSNSFFEKGYDLVKQRFSDYPIEFHKESIVPDKYSLSELCNIRNLYHYIKYKHVRNVKSDFRSKLISLLKSNLSTEIMFLTDDAMFIREVHISQGTLLWLRQKPYDRQLSLRLSLEMSSQEVRINKQNEEIFWNFYDNSDKNSWGYPFSVDAHIYSKALVIDLFSKYIFTSPNTLEGYICKQIQRKRLLSEGCCYSQTHLLSYPINMVQTFSDNETLGVSNEMMNGWYLDGYTMKYPVPESIKVFQQYPSFLFLYKGNIVMRKNL